MKAAASVVTILLLAGCAQRSDDRLTFWALGREGEVVAQMIPEFERRTGIEVRVQQIPWTAAHEKLLTAYVGEATPDLAQVGNTWVPEFEAIGAVDALDSRVASSQSVDRSDYFDGIWETNTIRGKTYGIPWYVDTRVLFYRKDLFAAVGYDEMPKTWSAWREAMARLTKDGRYAILLPTDEWPQPVIMALQTGAALVRDEGRTGAFRDPKFLEGFTFYVDTFKKGYAPVYSRTQVANRYLQFANGEFAMMITGPWEVGEFRDRIPADLQHTWMTAPLPSPDGDAWPGLSLAGGSSLVIFKASQKKDAAWKLIEYLSEPQQQIRFYDLMKNLPARKSAWDAPTLRENQYLRAFRIQLDRVVPTPKIPEWERLATMIAEYGERAIRTKATPQQVAASLDAAADQVLTKRRWMLDRETVPRAALFLGAGAPVPRADALFLGAGAAFLGADAPVPRADALFLGAGAPVPRGVSRINHEIAPKEPAAGRGTGASAPRNRRSGGIGASAPRNRRSRGTREAEEQAQPRNST